MNTISAVHATEVQRLAREVSQRHTKSEKVRIYHGRTNSTRKLHFDEKLIDISRLNNILEIDIQNKTATVEPNVTISQLVSATLEHGLLPQIVMEFPEITIGGAVQGGAGESSSFRYGGFHSSCFAYEIILGDGTIIEADKDHNTEFFEGLPCSCGTLGIVTRIALNLIESKPFVELTYRRVKCFDEAVNQLRVATKDPTTDFIDGILFAPDEGVIMTGTLSSAVPKNHVPTFSRARDEWFYLHAKKILSGNDTYTEYIAVREYLFRYDRGAFWTGFYGFRRTHLPFNRITRFLGNPLLRAKRLFRCLHGANLSQQFLVQDILLPRDKVKKFLTYWNRRHGFYPLWLLPIGPFYKSKWYRPITEHDTECINVGVYGEARVPYEEYVRINKEIEQQALGLNGRKVFYAHSFFTKDEFWSIYNKKEYDILRDLFRAKVSFPTIYEKVTVTKKYETSIWKGVRGLINSPYARRDSSDVEKNVHHK